METFGRYIETERVIVGHSDYTLSYLGSLYSIADYYCLTSLQAILRKTLLHLIEERLAQDTTPCNEMLR